jgi:hypothetical protein
MQAGDALDETALLRNIGEERYTMLRSEAPVTGPF